MLKIREQIESSIIPMSKMEPLQVGRVVQPRNPAHGSLVMRTASESNFEVMDLSDPRPDSCWDLPCNLPVQLLEPGEKVVVELFNE